MLHKTKTSPRMQRATWSYKRIQMFPTWSASERCAYSLVFATIIPSKLRCHYVKKEGKNFSFSEKSLLEALSHTLWKLPPPADKAMKTSSLKHTPGTCLGKGGHWVNLKYTLMSFSFFSFLKRCFHAWMWKDGWMEGWGLMTKVQAPPTGKASRRLQASREWRS